MLAPIFRPAIDFATDAPPATSAMIRASRTVTICRFAMSSPESGAEHLDESRTGSFAEILQELQVHLLPLLQGHNHGLEGDKDGVELVVEMLIAHRLLVDAAVDVQHEAGQGVDGLVGLPLFAS
ncbi:hypothetical protein GS415_10400 [Rhodococcus hoagii]|nr:hypothetical protein [Prescottella equi]